MKILAAGYEYGGNKWIADAAIASGEADPSAACERPMSSQFKRLFEST
jgi:hypothetical protein